MPASTDTNAWSAAQKVVRLHHMVNNIFRSATAYPIVNEDVFDTFVQTLKGHIEKCLASPEDRRLRQPVLQSIKFEVEFTKISNPSFTG